MSFYADLHIHSKYSRATSKNCDLENLTYWGRKKGITVIGTGDFTHPAWIQEIKDKLVPAEPGLFRLKDDIEKEVLKTLPSSCHGKTRFMLSVEISTIYKKGDKVRKIHHLIYAPTIEQAEKINARLEKIGNIRSDGRPILGLDSRHLLEIVLEAGDDCYLVPAHIWTPWFAVLGSKSGFDRVADCYADLADHVFAVETGLSSDPEMNWKVSSLDRYRLMSNSDAHSPGKLGREANLFTSELDYYAMKKALETGEGFGGTVEFFPEEGKYHMDGHRKCGIRFSPEESKAHQGICPTCAKPLTLGVSYRVHELADRHDDEKPDNSSEFRNFIPLPEMISETLGVGPASKKVMTDYEKMVSSLGSELPLLGDLPLDEIKKSSSSLITEAISRMREGKVIREAGFDGEYGRIKLFEEKELKNAMAGGVLFDVEIEKKKPSKKKKTDSKPSSVEGASSILKKVEALIGPASTLDTEQQQAVDFVKGPLLIIAGPGSGKTRTLTHRVANLVKSHGVLPEQCLTITFTRRASQEMKDRLEKLLPKRGHQVPVMTFHSLGYQILQKNRVAAGLPRGFRVASPTEFAELLINQLEYSEGKALKSLREVSSLKKQGVEPGPQNELMQVWDILNNAREKDGWIDYDDLLILSIKLLEEDQGLQAFYRELYPWVSIDEYQDIDELQYRLIKLFIPKNGNICAIGDPDQAIYSFRGADVGFFLRFEKDFSDAHKVRLLHNYRSGESILSASGQMISPSSLIEDRNIQALIEDTGKVVIHQSRTDKAEAEFVVHTIEQMIGGSSFFSMDSGRSSGESSNDLSFSDFAVLYRTELQAELLEEALFRSGMPFQRCSHKRFNEDPQVQKVLDSMAADETPTDILKSLQEIQKQFSESMQPTFDKMFSIANRFTNNWDGFVQEMNLSEESDAWDKRADRISLLTLHASKGLEFPVVFVVGCENGLIPLKWGDSISKEERDEERRLFYVGMTRAKRKLILSYANKRLWMGKVRDQRASPFLKDIEEKLLERRKSDVKKKAPTKEESQLSLL